MFALFSYIRLKEILLFFLLIIIGTGLFFSTKEVYATMPELNTNSVGSAKVVEYIRLSVPSKYKKAWLQVEKQTWAEWLSKKDGFLGRQLFWDPNKEQATLLISWSSVNKWKSISSKEIDSIQSEFEVLARELTGQSAGNPFPLQSEGELWPQ